MDQLNEILETSKEDGIVCFDVFWHNVKLDNIEISGDESADKKKCVEDIFF